MTSRSPHLPSASRPMGSRSARCPVARLPQATESVPSCTPSPNFFDSTRLSMRAFRYLVVSLLAAAAFSVSAQQPPVLIYGIMELSGTGATPGTNFDNGVKLAVKEINAAGGILGRKINYVSTDTQTNPAVAKAVA